MTASRFLIAGSVAALLHMGVAVAQTPSPTDPPTHPATPDAQQPATPSPSDPPTHPAMEGKEAQQQGVTFESLDTDADGRISKTEAEADAKVSKQFATYDKNGNGFIEKDEVMSSKE